MNKETCVILPAYNEENHITRVIEGLLSEGFPIVVIDDGSTDSTFEKASSTGVKVLQHKINQGKGSALFTGFKEVLANKEYKYFLILDSDGQHDYTECYKFIKKADTTDAALIIGYRMWKPEDMPLDRRIVNRLTSFLISIVCGQKILDCQSGFRLLKRELLENVIFTAERYDIECDMIIKSAKAGFKIDFVPIKSIYADEHSSINPMRDTFRFIILYSKAIIAKFLF